MQLFALFFSVFGVAVLYLSHENQGLISKKLTKGWRLTGSVGVLTALAFWWQITEISAGIFMWLFTCLTVAALFPFVSMIRRTSKFSE